MRKRAPLLAPRLTTIIALSGPPFRTSSIAERSEIESDERNEVNALSGETTDLNPRCRVLVSSLLSGAFSTTNLLLSYLWDRFNFYLRLTLEIVSGEIKRKKEEIKEENYAVI